MIRFFWIALVLPCAAGWLIAGTCCAAETAEKQPTVWRWIADMAAPKETRRDPTRAAPQLRQLLDPAKTQAQTPARAAEPPLVQLKGRIVGGGQPSAALLEINKQSYLLRKGSEISLSASHSNAQTLRVVDVTSDAVRVELMPLGLTLILN